MPGPYISQIQLKNGKSFNFDANDVVVFVGSNNCGKSTTLKEIDSLYENNNKNEGNKLIANITISNDLNDQEMKELVISKSHKKIDRGKNVYQGIGYAINETKFDDTQLRFWVNNSTNYHKVFTSMLDTDGRLNLVKRKNNKDNGYDAPSEVYHIYSDDCMKFNKLKTLFEKIFSTKLFFIPGYHNLKLDFKVSDTDQVEYSYNDPNYTEAKAIYNRAESIDEQGDGMKSFTGITSELISGDKNTYFIDEPESFLHPPQANILGQEIGELSEGQIFLATHSQDFLKGIIKSNSERVKIFRIIRNRDYTVFKPIEKEDLLLIQSDPFLHYSNYLDSLFNHHSVICEDATDCIFYNKIFDLVLKEEGKETLSINYVYTGGKNNFPKVYKLCLKLGIKPIIIGDIDVLNNWSFLERLIGAGSISEMLGNRRKLKSKVELLGNTTITGQQLKEEINSIISDVDIISKNDSKKVGKIFTKLKKPWDNLKQKGEKIYGKTPKYYQEMIAFLEHKGLYLVPFGEMESFIPSIKSKKKNFVNEALQLENNSLKLNKVKSFVKKIVGRF